MSWDELVCPRCLGSVADAIVTGGGMRCYYCNAFLGYVDVPKHQAFTLRNVIEAYKGSLLTAQQCKRYLMELGYTESSAGQLMIVEAVKDATRNLWKRVGD